MTVAPLTVATLARPIRVHGLADARAAAMAADNLGLPLTLMAGGYGGAPWLMGIMARVASEYPTLRVSGLLDCDDRAGEAQAALAAGMSGILFTGPPGVAARLAVIAVARGAVVLTDRPPALDPRGHRDPVAACRTWLSASPST